MRLLLFNLATDINDPVVGFATGWIRALAKQMDLIHVVTMRAGKIDVPDNVRVYSVGKEKGFSKPRRALEFYRFLFHILREERIDACFSHMMPVFTILAAPLLKCMRIPIVTWYAHPSLTWTLKIAHRVSDRMVSSIVTSYPYQKDKLVVIGHGIDTDIFSSDGRVSSERAPMILCVGRLSPVKDHSTLLNAACLLRQRLSEPFRVVIVGGPGSPRDENYVQLIHEQVRDLELDGIVSFESPAPMASLRFWYRRCAAHVNLTPTGFVDKVALEAMACARPCLVANEGFKETLGDVAERLLFRHGDAEHLAEKLAAILELCERDRDQMGQYLHQRTIQMHSLNHLTFGLMDVLREVSQYQDNRHTAP
jgi:glycosyltransferase involved in cell wall biosynthesis